MLMQQKKTCQKYDSHHKKQSIYDVNAAKEKMSKIINVLADYLSKVLGKKFSEGNW